MTVPQHMDALNRAQAVRLQRARLRAEVNALGLADGRERVADLLDKRHPLIQTMMIRTLLGWISRNSDRAIQQALESADVTRNGRLVRELTDRQIIAIEDALVLQADSTRGRRRLAA